VKTLAKLKLNPVKDPLTKVESEIGIITNRIEEMSSRHQKNLDDINELKMKCTGLSISQEVDGVDHRKEIRELDRKIEQIERSLSLYSPAAEKLARRLDILKAKQRGLTDDKNVEELRRLAGILNKRTRRLIALLTEANALNDKILKDHDTFIKLHEKIERPPQNLPHHAYSHWSLTRLLHFLKDLLDGGNGLIEISSSEFNSRLL